MTDPHAQEPAQFVDHREAFTKTGIAIGTALATGAGGSFAIVAGVGALMGEYAPVVLSEWRSKGHRIDAMGDVAIDQAGSSQALLDGATQSEEAQSFFVRAVEGAAGTEYPPSIRAIGRALARGLLDDGAKLDGERQYVEALSQVRRPHVVVMWTLRTDSGVPTEGGGSGWLPLTLSRTELREALPESYGATLDRLLATLEREGLVDRGTGIPKDLTYADMRDGRPAVRDDPNTHWALTSFGLASLARLYEEGASDDVLAHEA